MIARVVRAFRAWMDIAATLPIEARSARTDLSVADAFRRWMALTATLRIYVPAVGERIEFARLDDALDAFEAGDLKIDDSPAWGTRPLIVSSHFGATRLWRRDVDALVRRRRGGAS